MKINNILLGSMATALLLLSAGCSSLGSIFGPKTGKESKSSSKTEAVLPRDREQISTTEDLKTYTAEDIKKGVVKGDWAIETVNGKPAVGEKAPYLRFSPAEK
ncbi:MAG: hypothetical protein K2J87_05710, partial [Muribaculaceae bacterium]|nr:hypothetical protein [Muribaculaceae bacterium]